MRYCQSIGYYIKEFEDTKGVIRIRISQKNRHHNGQKKKCKRTKTKDRVTRTPLNTVGDLYPHFPKSKLNN